MGTQEWILLSLVLIVPLIIAMVVTLWTLEQAIKRNKKNQRGRNVRRVAEPVIDTDPVESVSQESQDKLPPV
ncbi:hypothetical protein BH09CHL1_BH09CHL1_24170 [soil metagenome]